MVRNAGATWSTFMPSLDRFARTEFSFISAWYTNAAFRLPVSVAA